MDLLKVVVGSKLHRLDTPDSDTDTKGVFVSDLRDLTSPFKHLDKAKTQTDDNTKYELRHFCSLATKGNPTVLEVLWSDLVEKRNTFGKELQDNKFKFLDARAVRAAHLGYANSQRKKLERHGLDDHRTRKHLVAHLRVLMQGYDLLRNGDFKPDMSRSHPREHQLMLQVKTTGEGKEELLAKIEEWDAQVEKTVAPYTPNYEWIESFCYKVYTSKVKKSVTK